MVSHYNRVYGESELAHIKLGIGNAMDELSQVPNDSTKTSSSELEKVNADSEKIRWQTRVISDIADSFELSSSDRMRLMTHISQMPAESFGKAVENLSKLIQENTESKGFIFKTKVVDIDNVLKSLDSQVIDEKSISAKAISDAAEINLANSKEDVMKVLSNNHNLSFDGITREDARKALAHLNIKEGVPRSKIEISLNDHSAVQVVHFNKNLEALKKKAGMVQALQI